MIALRWLCWVPLILLNVVEVYVRRFDGWGAWAAAPILLVPGIVSLAIVLWGLYECVVKFRTGKLGLAAPLYTVIAGLPLLWLVVRRFVV